MTGFGSRGKLLGSVLAIAVVAACGNSTSEKVRRGQIPMETFTAEQIYERAEYELTRNKPEEAGFFFSEIERLYPYSDWTKRGLIMQAFSYHKAEEYDQARAAAQRFIDFYPADDDAAYAQYLLALTYYDQIDEVGRDQKLTFEALQELRKVIETYPESEYANAAKLKFDLAFDHLASKEMEVGRYYLRRGHFAAAISRFRVVVEDFQTTTQTPEALHRLVEAYLSLGLSAEAQTAGAILGYNYQSTDWYDDSYGLLTANGLFPKEEGSSWLSQIYRQTVKGDWL